MATLLMPGCDKFDLLAFRPLMDDRGWVLLYKWDDHFLYIRSMFLDGWWDMV